MAGYSDLPFRCLCREEGAACCVTEMVSAKGLWYDGLNTWKVLETVPWDTPLVVQLFGAEADCLGWAVRRLREKGFAWFDLNMGCSVPKVARQGAGSAMLRDPDNALACARAMIAAALPGHVSFKLRLGVGRDAVNWLDLALRLEDAGAGLVTLHPRTAQEGFGGQAHWEAIAEAKRRLGIPVLASGGLFAAEDGVRCLKETGADGVMYARGALARPSVFKEHKALLRGEPAGKEIPAGELRRLIRRHMELIGRFGSEDNALYRLRSIVPRYVRSIPGVRLLRQRLCACQSLGELDGILDAFLAGSLAGAGGACGQGGSARLDKFDPPLPSCGDSSLPDREHEPWK
ncbi:MAG: tRNA-dihydrouridine synthase [Desulfovibrio sp.]|nr:tRNA-dihydrouridine synthase [Desulfovibrio sp.]